MSTPPRTLPHTPPSISAYGAISMPSPAPPASAEDSTASPPVRSFKSCHKHGTYANFPLIPEPPYDYAAKATGPAVPSSAKLRMPAAINAMMQRSDSMVSTA